MTKVFVVLNENFPGQGGDRKTGSMDPTSVRFTAAGQPRGSVVSVYARTLTGPDQGVYTADRVTGAVTFDPGPRFVGTASPVAYSAQDSVPRWTGEIVHNPTASTLTVTVTEVTPVAVDNWSNTEIGKAVYVRVLGNDRPGAASAPLVPSSVRLELGPGLPRSSTLSADRTRLTVPGRAVYTVRTDGLVVVVPAPGFVGVVPTVRYTVSDTNGTTASATVAVGVH